MVNKFHFMVIFVQSTFDNWILYVAPLIQTSPLPHVTVDKCLSMLRYFFHYVLLNSQLTNVCHAQCVGCKYETVKPQLLLCIVYIA